MKRFFLLTLLSGCVHYPGIPTNDQLVAVHFLEGPPDCGAYICVGTKKAHEMVCSSIQVDRSMLEGTIK